MTIIIVAGTRPNFIKIAPIVHQLTKENISFQIVHTGQHYQDSLNDIFFRELSIPPPNINLQVGSGSQAEQVAAIMIGFEKFLQSNLAPIVLVVGDVNSTMACSLVAKKMGRQLLHVEGGIRSFDLEMPEEINRLVTDSITDHFYTTSTFANDNLVKAGINRERINFVGNTMIDTLHQQKLNFKKPEIFDSFSLQKNNYWVLTIHRPSNVDHQETLENILLTINNNCDKIPVILPVHPRITEKIKSTSSLFPFIHFIEPLGYLEFMYLVQHSIGVITDSGGIQEETTVLNISCLTLRKNTERPETITTGTNQLIPELSQLPDAMKKISMGNGKKGSIPEKWDGKAAERIVHSIKCLYT